MIKALLSVLHFVAALGWILFVVLWWMPASFWLTYHIDVENSVAGGPSPKITADATFRKTIHLNWNYTLWKWSGEGWVSKCSSEGDAIRSPGFIPGPMTLETIFDGCAKDLKAGSYSVQTDLAWDDMGAKSIGIDSDFEITEPDHPIATGHRIIPIQPQPEVRVHSLHRRPKSCLPFFLNMICR